MSRRSKYVAAVGLLAAAAIGFVTALSPFASDGNADLSAEVAFTFQDETIAESSGLVVRGDLAYTVNDSGDGPFVYAVDRRTGETVGVTTFDDEEPEDLEALAPGRGRALWVGDTGDNRRARGSVRVHRFVPPAGGGTVESQKFDLAYPDGPHDAETLLVHPRTGRVLVVSKRPIIGGVVYRAPRELRAGEVHRLQPVANVSGLVTDGTFLPDGRHVLLRTPGGAAVYTYPEFDRVAELELPVQDQGEGVAVGEDGRMYLSSEGELSDVLVMDLPPLSEGEAGPAPTSAPADEEAGGQEGEDRTGLGRPRGYLLAALLGSVVVGWLVRASRRRSRRRR